MKRKTLIIFTILIVLLVTVVALFGGKSNTQNQPGSNTSRQIGFADIFSNLGDLFSFKQESGVDQNQDIELGDDPNNQNIGTYSALKKVSNDPVSGFLFYDYEEKYQYTDQSGVEKEEVLNKNMIRYMKRINGFVSDTNTQEFPITEIKVSNTTIPKIHEALFYNGGLGVVIRFLGDDLNTIKTFVGEIKPGSVSQPGSITGNFIEEDIPEISINKIGNMVYYKKSSFETFFYNKNLNTSSNDSFFNSSFYSWIIDFANNKTLTLSTKGSYFAKGYVYSLSLDGKLNKIVGGKNGLVGKLSPNEKYLLYSVSDGGLFRLYIYNIDDKKDFDTGLKTLVDKCVWGESSEYIYCAVPQGPLKGNYPDDWYLGNKSFSDSIWKVNTTNNSAFKINDISISGKEEIDAINLQINSLENRLGFINKNNYTLWMLEL